MPSAATTRRLLRFSELFRRWFFWHGQVQPLRIENLTAPILAQFPLETTQSHIYPFYNFFFFLIKFRTYRRISSVNISICNLFVCFETIIVPILSEVSSRRRRRLFNRNSKGKTKRHRLPLAILLHLLRMKPLIHWKHDWR